jgi:two-component system CheB/CheR fusion protein
MPFSHTAPKELEEASQVLRRGEQAMAAELETAQRLQSLSMHLIAAGDSQALCQQILDAALAILKADLASIQILHPKRGPEEEPRLLAYRGCNGPAAALWERDRPSSTSSCGLVLRTRQRAAIPDIEHCDFLVGTVDLETFRRTGIRAMQTTPLLSRSGAVLGVFSTHWREPHTLSASELRSLDILARMTADLIERSQAEERLRDSEQRLQLLIENVREYALVETDLSGHVTSWNSGAARLFGYPSVEMLGQSFSRLLTPEDRTAGVLEREINVVGDKGRNEDARWLVRSDGSRFWARWVTESVRDEAGHLQRLASILRDDTERQRGSEVVLQRQKLESVGLLAGGVAHDFNNLLTGIMGNASLIVEEMPPGSAKRVREIIRGAERAAQLTKQLLAYSGKGPTIIQDVDISEAVSNLGGLVEFSIPKSVQLALAVQKRLPLVRMDPGQLQQILMNLVINAGEAIGEGAPGKITVTTGVADVDKSFVDALGQEIVAGRYVVIEVQDTGSGIDDQSRAKIFDPFYTTKRLGRGLGLAAVAGIIRVQRGALTLESMPGGGSTFRIFLPVISDAVQEPEDQPVGNSRGTILIVDDEGAVREFVGTVLRQQGYRVVLASDGREALTTCDREGGDIHAVLLDVVMPVMGAKEFLPVFGVRHPEAKVLLTSGYDEAGARQLCAAYPMAAFIQKPYTAQQIASAVGKLLGTTHL